MRRDDGGEKQATQHLQRLAGHQRDAIVEGWSWADGIFWGLGLHTLYASSAEKPSNSHW